MNNFELDKRAKALVDTTTHYGLARRVAEYEAREGNLANAGGQRWASCALLDSKGGGEFRKVTE